jgi:hypothetical protein
MPLFPPYALERIVRDLREASVKRLNRRDSGSPEGDRRHVGRRLEQSVIARPFACDEVWSELGNSHGRGFSSGLSKINSL